MRKERKLHEKALLIGIRLPGQSREEVSDSQDELASLATSAGAIVVGWVTQELKKIDPAFFIGSGKIEEILEAIASTQANLCIFDEDLSPSQQRNLQEALKIKIIDRTGLILDIFAQRAKTREGKLQVELAQALYLLPRLVGQWSHFSRQTGGIGTRGPGETQLEVDRRRAREKIRRLREALKKVETSRQLHRTQRLVIPLPTVSLVGYTNAGKSTLMNRLTGAGVHAENLLFATLDPTIRRLKLPSGREVLLADTVGFIRKLPHSLVESFKATFEEIGGSDLLLHVIDASHPQRKEQIEKVAEVLKDLELADKPILEVHNKIDRLNGYYPEGKDKICISAAKQANLSELLLKLDECLAKDYKPLKVKIPQNEGNLIHLLHRYARILSKKYENASVILELEVFEKYLSRLEPYRILE